MPHFIVAITLFILMCSVSSCEAQRVRLFQRLSQSGPQHSHLSQAVHSSFQQQQANRFELTGYPSYRNPVVSRILDGPVAPTRRDPIENNSRYIGGFHQKHFDNIGIPSGDIGIRGNAYNWRPW